MFNNLIKISDRPYRIYNRSKSTKVIAIPSEYAEYKDLSTDQYLYAFMSTKDGNKLLCFSSIELKGTIKVKISTNAGWLRLTVPKLIYNMLNHNDNLFYAAYHNDREILIFKQKESL